MEEKKAYLIGLNIGATFRGQLISPDLNIVLKGIVEGMRGGKTKLSEEEMQKVMKAIQDEIAANHKRAGDDFLARNRKQPGVTATASGLQYKILKRGSGRSPTAKDKVTVHYRGTLMDGSTFDDSYQREEPLTIGLERVIKGWTEALQLMKEGDKWQLFVPTELAYREAPPMGAPIPPNAMLIFEVELLRVN
jgi:FKBP-type peptidyl-prolyl cis-trans isomerase FklB